MINNILDTIKLLNVKSIIYFSSVDVYGIKPILQSMKILILNLQTIILLQKSLMNFQ